MLYCWGDGALGQLGLGEGAGVAEPVPFRRGPQASRGREAVLVACGERHTVLLRADGRVASCGDNGRGQLGRRLPEGCQRSYVPGRTQWRAGRASPLGERLGGGLAGRPQRASLLAPPTFPPWIDLGWDSHEMPPRLSRGASFTPSRFQAKEIMTSSKFLVRAQFMGLDTSGGDKEEQRVKC